MVLRKCVGCGEIKERNNMIKITKTACDVVINPDNKTFGRSAYLCYNNSCVEAALKKNKISKVLRAAVSEDLKGKLLNEF